jgi:oligoendopeptidase F
VPSYLELLSAGGSDRPEVLAALVGVDLTDPGFWDAGLAVIGDLVDEAEKLADSLA